MERNPGVYVITVGPQETFYIGSTSNLETRKATHLHALNKGIHPNAQLQRAYEKGGNFEFTPFPQASKEVALDEEQILIDTHYENPLCCNLAENSRSSTLGKILSNEEKEEKRLQNLGRKHTPETKAKIFESKIGICSDERREHLQSLASAQKGIPLSEEHRNNISSGSKGRVMTEEHRRRISEALKGKKKSPEHFAKVAEARKDFRHSEETKLRIKESVNKTYALIKENKGN